MADKPKKDARADALAFVTTLPTSARIARALGKDGKVVRDFVRDKLRIHVSRGGTLDADVDYNGTTAPARVHIFERFYAEDKYDASRA